MDCRCSACEFSLCYRFEMPPIIFKEVKCYPIFPCIIKNHRQEDYDYLAVLSSTIFVLINCNLTEGSYFYLQRGLGTFYLAFESMLNAHKLEHNIFVPAEGIKQSAKKVDLFPSSCVVLYSKNIVYNQFPIQIHGFTPTYTFTGLSFEEGCKNKKRVTQTVQETPPSYAEWKQPLGEQILSEQKNKWASHSVHLYKNLEEPDWVRGIDSIDSWEVNQREYYDLQNPLI